MNSVAGADIRWAGERVEAVEALSAAEADKALFFLENDPVGTALLGFISDQVYFEGTARQLLEGLKERSQVDQDSRLSPKCHRAVENQPQRGGSNPDAGHGWIQGKIRLQELPKGIEKKIFKIK